VEHQPHQPQSDAAAAAGHHRDLAMRDEMMHMSQKMMDVVDVRIEGMEDMLHHLQTTVHGLGDKVSSNTIRWLFFTKSITCHMRLCSK